MQCNQLDLPRKEPKESKVLEHYQVMLHDMNGSSQDDFDSSDYSDKNEDFII